MVAFLIGDIMAAVTPADSSYWAVTFPSLLLVISGPDLSFSTGQLIVSNSVDREFQGIAGECVSRCLSQTPNKPYDAWYHC